MAFRLPWGFRCSTCTADAGCSGASLEAEEAAEEGSTTPSTTWAEFKVVSPEACLAEQPESLEKPACNGQGSAESCLSVSGPPPLDDLPDRTESEQTSPPLARRRRCPGAQVLGLCVAFAVLLLSLSIVGFVASTTRGHGFVRPCVEADESQPLEVWVVTSATSLLLVTPLTVLVTSLAANAHLRWTALYSCLSWLSRAVSFTHAYTICEGHTDEGVAKWAGVFYGAVLPCCYVARIVVYVVLLKQRLMSLEVSSFRPLGARAFQCLLLLACLDWFVGGIVAALILMVFGEAPSLDIIMGLLFWIGEILWMTTIGTAVRVMATARATLLALAATSQGRVAAEASRAARTMAVQIAGLLSSIPAAGAAFFFLLSFDMAWPLQRSEDPASQRMVEVASNAIAVVDVVGSSFAVLVLSGGLSGALRAAWARKGRTRQRRRRWRRSSRVWRPQCCENGAAWQEKVEELAGRGISLGEILRFYRGLGSDYMEHYSPSLHRTVDVVWQAVIPLSCESRSALSTVAMKGNYSRPHKMVTHNWGNLFRDLVAAIVADALGESEYGRVSYLLRHDIEKLEQWVRHTGKHSQVYWVCAFSVNQHLSICGAERRPKDPVTGDVPAACACGLPKALNGTAPSIPDGRSIPCEMNKFDSMIQFLSATDQHFEHVIAVDAEFRVFSRAWCVSEIAAAHSMGMAQYLKLWSAGGLARHEDEMRQLRIQDMSASREEDKKAILAAIPDVEVFNGHLQSLLFEDLIQAWNNLDASEQMLFAGRLIRWHGVARDPHSLPGSLWRECTI